MTWFPAFPNSQCLLRIVAGVVAAAALPSYVSAQTGPEPGAPAAGAAKRQPASDRDQPATIHAEQISGNPDREVTVGKDVEIVRGGTRITADTATYHVIEDQVDADGHIRMERYGDRYTGDELKLKIEAGQGYVTNPTYRLERNNAQGRAERIDFESEDRAVVTDGSYSTCEGPDPDWYLKSDTLRLDNGRDVGTASKTVVYFKGVPILATPAMSFPLSDARKSGVLPPSFGTTNKGGVEISVPYYFNIAPNRDLTLYPNAIARRGLQLGAHGRYLSQNYSGETRLEVLPNDNQTKTTRYAITSTHSHVLAPGLGMNWNLSTASDDDYPSDFPRTLTTASQRLLLRDLSFGYGSAHWTAGARFSNYMVLQDPAAPITRPYDRLPQLTFRAGRQDVHGFDWTVDAELTRFWHPTLLRGTRFVLNPKLAYPIIRPGYFITPKLSFDLTKYALDDAPGAAAAATAARNLTRSLPTMSVDSGLVFEREANFFGQRMTQTLEPRLFYVRTPYRDQSAFPNFDTAEADLSFAQLFSENRFIGHDRISDANQLTAALVSRYIEPTGVERLRVALGQRYYFSDQRVTLGTGVVNESRSDLLASASGRLTSTLTAEATMQYSRNLHALNRANFGVRWQPAPKQVLNLQYRRDLFNNLKQVDVSSQWPVARRWYGVGRINYSLPDSKVVEGLLGMEYKADCWVFRIVGQRIPTGTGKATSAYFFQLELNGLTRLGSNPLEALRSSIPGYQLVNQP
ncbi:MAG TPA: LPS-assembly protein LptD [Paucimonas sp.]|nr:LPS-assembly protein LptD [Paucimonas sp.]